VFLNNQGASDASGQISTTDGNIFFSVDAGTKLLDAQNQPITQITASIPTSMPAPPSQNAIVLPYDFGPDGATFEPPMTLTLKYDPATLPQGVNESTLYIAYWDGSQWQVLPSTVDTVAKTLTVMISHFTDYAVMVPLATTTATAAPLITPKSGSNLAIILISAFGVVILVALVLFFVMRRKNKIVFVTDPQTIRAGVVSKMITIQIRNAKDKPVKVTRDTIIDLSSSSGGNFSAGSDGILTTTTIKLAEGSDSTGFYYIDKNRGSVTITASNNKLMSGKQTETID